MPSTLRRIVDVVAATAALAVVSSIGWYGYTEFEHHRNVKRVSEELRRFNSVLAFQAASGQTQINSRGWPMTIEPAWFTPGPPKNVLISPERPWVDIAPPEHANLTDPMVRMAINHSVAAFWYNPYRGIVRARVPMQFSDERTLSLYNTVNGTSLTSIHAEQMPSPVVADAADGDAAPSAEEPTGHPQTAEVEPTGSP